jgi:hypothetical protein
MAYHHLNIEERDIIATQLNLGMSYRAIANIKQNGPVWWPKRKWQG